MPKAENPENTKYWLDKAAQEISSAHPTGELIVASGVSPSGPYHVGGLREVLTADAIAYTLKQSGRQAKHLHFCDDLDPLRKVPAGADKMFEKFIGEPYSGIPDLFQCHKSFADHYLSQFLEVIEPLKLDMEILRAHELYGQGKFKHQFDQSLSKIEEVREIIVRVSGRHLPENWEPIQEYADGVKKLNWRLDWPARWKVFGVHAEPFGRDHATKGGSYDTGVELVKEIFGGEPPLPIPYEFINLKGQTKKMSASAGTGLTPADVLDVMPPEILRYFVLKSRPERTLSFDPGIGIYNLIEEYSQIEQAVEAGEDHEFRRAFEVARGDTKEQIISRVPFTHVVSTFQAAQGDIKLGLEILARGGYEQVVKEDEAIIKREWKFVKNWLEKYAPEEVKFEVQKALPKVELDGAQKQFLVGLADGLEKEPDLNGQGIHDLVYACREKADLRPQQAFQAIYRVLLGKDSGPRAGWFLESLDREFVLNRLRLKA